MLLERSQPAPRACVVARVTSASRAHAYAYAQKATVFRWYVSVKCFPLQERLPVYCTTARPDIAKVPRYTIYPYIVTCTHTHTHTHTHSHTLTHTHSHWDLLVLRYLVPMGIQRETEDFGRMCSFLRMPDKVSVMISL